MFHKQHDENEANDAIAYVSSQLRGGALSNRDISWCCMEFHVMSLWSCFYFENSTIRLVLLQF